MKITKNRCYSCQKEVNYEQENICKYCKHYLNAEKIKIGEKIIYLPNKSSMLRGITDNAYEDLNFHPGEVMTVKGFEIDKNGFKFILVKEKKIRFSPFELIPEIAADKNQLTGIVELYQKLNKKC